MASARKRPRQETADDARAECPFHIPDINLKSTEQKNKKRRRKTSGDDEEVSTKTLQQLSPFSPSGKFTTYETLDRPYTVEPSKKWSDMTRYNSFVCRCHFHSMAAKPRLISNYSEQH
jgi:hypothetical protein